MQKTLLLGLLGLVTAPIAFGQSLFVDNFAYADSLTVGGTLSGDVSATNATTGWATHSGTINQIKAGATFNRTLATTPAYPSQSGSGIQLLASRGEDISHQFTQQTADGTVIYASAIVTPTAVPNGVNGSYFMHLSINTLAGAGYVGRVWAAAGATPGTVKYGVSAVSNAPVFASGEFATGTSVLLVLKYEMVAGASNNVASLYTLPAGSDITTEPGAPDATQTSAGTDPANIGAIALRQGTTTTGTSQNSGSMMIDGVRVGLTWNDAPLPVELNAFTGQANGTTARLAWTTASETNNLGFYVEQQDGESWNTVSGLVAGHGTTTERNAYTFDVNNLTAGTHTFRLRQVDTDGTVHYSPTTTVEIAAQGGLALTALGARGLRVESENGADVSVYDLLGRRVMAERVGSGTTVLQLDGVSSGVYVVRAESDGRAVTTRLVVR
ncbi:MAG: T9SS type A sorting domain-containing protein [Rhodothermales bacterium]|nr:T9SS type A sorting domain-containing protein [Rhodothermales bacterium]